MYKEEENYNFLIYIFKSGNIERVDLQKTF